MDMDSLRAVTQTHSGPYTPDEWTALALCQSDKLVELDAWFAPPGSAAAVQAAATCFICPARLSCLAAACDRDEQWGIWGGEQFEQEEELPDVPLCHNGLHVMTQDNKAHRGNQIKCLECERERSRRRRKKAM